MQVNERRVGGYRSVCVVTRRVCISRLTSRRSQPPLALSVPLSRFTSRVGGGSAFFVRHHLRAMKTLITVCSLIIAFVCKSQPAGVTTAPPSDAKLTQQIAGTWTRGPFSWTEAPLFRRTYSPDGSFTTSIGHTNALVTYKGTWLVKDQALVMTVTNAQGTGNHGTGSPVGHVDGGRIIYLDEHQFIYETDGHTNRLTR